MIGVIVNSSERPVVSEFFELFKTPWEFYRSDRHYDVVLCSGDAGFEPQCAKLILLYAGEKLEFDAEEQIEICSRKSTGHAVLQRSSTAHLWGLHNLRGDGGGSSGR